MKALQDEEGATIPTDIEAEEMGFDNYDTLSLRPTYSVPPRQPGRTRVQDPNQMSIFDVLDSSGNTVPAAPATAPVNTSSADAHISFWVKNQKRLTYQDVLEVKYRTSLADDWTTLATYNTNISSWRELSLNLPKAEFLQVAFVGTAHFGRGIGIDDVTFAQGTVVGINTALAKDIDVNIYPNPASKVVNISAINSNENIGYEVYDLMGRCLTKGEVEAHQNTSIATSDWKAGVYVVRLRAGNNEKTRQLIVK